MTNPSTKLMQPAIPMPRDPQAVVEILREMAKESRSEDRSVGVFADDDTADVLEWAADCLTPAAPAANGRPIGQQAERLRNLHSMLIAVGVAAFHLAENTEDNGDRLTVQRVDFDALSGALDSLDELPDDKPGYTLAGPGRAEWALEKLLASPATAKTVGPDECVVTREDGNNYCEILRVLGMEEEGDPVAAVRRLVALEESAPAVAPSAQPVRADERYELTRSIIHACPALKLPQTFLQRLGMTAQIVPLKGLSDEQAQAIVDRINGLTIGAAPSAGDAASGKDDPVAKIAANDADRLAGELESMRLNHWTHWTPAEVHIVAVAVRHLRLLAATPPAPTEPKEPGEGKQDALFGFSRSHIEDIAEGLEKGYPKSYYVGNECPEARSTTAYAAQFIRAALASQEPPAQQPLTQAQVDEIFDAHKDAPVTPGVPHGFIKPDNDRQVFFYEQDFYVLSNFSAFSLVWDGFRFDTSEAAYHHMKFPDHAKVQNYILHAPSAHEAFKIAERNKHLRRPDWDAVKVDIMRDILRAKVAKHEYVRRKLLATGDRELIEDSWRDDFWGWGPNRDGQNMLGKLWMEVRAELRSAAPGAVREEQR